VICLGLMYVVCSTVDWANVVVLALHSPNSQARACPVLAQ
jgi:hypothetical protein